MEKMWKNAEVKDFVVEHDTKNNKNELYQIMAIYEGQHVKDLRTIKLNRVNTKFSNSRERIISINGNTNKIMDKNVVILKEYKEYYIDTKIALRRYKRGYQGKINVLDAMSKLVKKG